MNDIELQGMSKILRHRLRGIAAGIRGALELIQEEGGSQLPPGLQEYFPLMMRECDALQEIPGRLSLLFDTPPSAENAGADVITMRAMGVAGRRFPGVDLRLQGTTPSVVSGWMEAALTELLVNACEAAPKGTVHVRLEAAGGGVRWMVSDFGPGVDRTRGDPFAPFVTTRPRHLGLGLPIARRLAEGAGGRCEESTAGPGDAAWTVELTCPALDLENPVP